MSEERKVVVTDGQNLVNEIEDMKKDGVTDVTVVVNTFNYTRYKQSNDGKQLQPVIDGINKSVDAGFKIRLNVAIKEGFNDDEILDFLQLTLLHYHNIVFLPTMDYDKIKAKLPGLVPCESDYEGVDMYKYSIAKGKIGFLEN